MLHALGQDVLLTLVRERKPPDTTERPLIPRRTRQFLQQQEKQPFASSAKQAPDPWLQNDPWLSYQPTGTKATAPTQVTKRIDSVAAQLQQEVKQQLSTAGPGKPTQR